MKVPVWTAATPLFDSHRVKVCSKPDGALYQLAAQERRIDHGQACNSGQPLRPKGRQRQCSLSLHNASIRQKAVLDRGSVIEPELVIDFKSAGSLRVGLPAEPHTTLSSQQVPLARAGFRVALPGCASPGGEALTPCESAHSAVGPPGTPWKPAASLRAALSGIRPSYRPALFSPLASRRVGYLHWRPDQHCLFWCAALLQLLPA